MMLTGGPLTAKASFHMPVIDKAAHDCRTKSRRHDIDLSPLYKSSEPAERFILLTLPFRTVILFILTWPNQPRNPRVGWADGLLMCAAYYSSEITVGPLSHPQNPPASFQRFRELRLVKNKSDGYFLSPFFNRTDHRLRLRLLLTVNVPRRSSFDGRTNNVIYAAPHSFLSFSFLPFGSRIRRDEAAAIGQQHYELERELTGRNAM